MSTSYVRSRDGKTVHRAGACSYARPPFGIPWPWAEGMTVMRIRMTGTRIGITYRWCRRCFPELRRDGAS